MKEEVTIQNFAAGELSPKMLGRYELAVSKSGCRRIRNFICETQGPARYRCGFRTVHYTRRNQDATLIDFQFNDEQAYQLEFTDRKLRFYKDEGIIVEADKTITAITKANPGVVTAIAHGYSNGDEVFLGDILGMTELNGRTVLVANKGTDTFQLTDIDGVNIDTTGFTTYASGGAASRIYEIDTPYDVLSNLRLLKVTQNSDVMYIDHPLYDPRKLTRTGHTAWTLLRYIRTNDPFLDEKVISGVTAASPGVVTSAGHGYLGGETIIIEEIIGMTQLNSRPYTVAYIDANTFSLLDYFTGVAVNTSAYTAYSSVGFASDADLLPSVPAFYEGRLFHGGIAGNPAQFIGSRSPVPTTGAPRPDDFTAGTDPDHAVYFSIADSEVNKIRWLIGTNRVLMAGTFGSEVRIAGETSDKPITPSSINVRSENRLGVADISPINKENIVIYIQRGSLTMRTFEFDALKDAFVSVDRNLVSEHVTKGGVTQICWQTGRPDIVWAVTGDGRLIGNTFKSGEDVSGWHVHDTGAAYGDKFLSVSTMPRPTQFDQLWVVTERVIGGHTRRFVEFMEDEQETPDFADFYTSEEGYAADKAKYVLAMQEAQKGYMHLDCAASYDGSMIGLDADATIMPSAVTGSITVTSDNAVFKSTDVGREIRKKSSALGVGAGRARITVYNSPTNVTCAVLSTFDDTDSIQPGGWYLTTDEVTNAHYLTGREVQVVVDGGIHPNQTVVNGRIPLDAQYSVVHLGFDFTGFLQPMNIEAGGTTGPAHTKNRHVHRVDIRFLNTLGAEYGTNVYKSEDIEFTQMPLQVGAPQLLFTGVKSVHLEDDWNLEKFVFVRQTKPLPCIVQLLEVFSETDND